ncbi:hypothetical protein H632_c4954p0, partial [Helicosporidium sp. ATCC 50920]
MEEQCARLERELALDQYKDAERRHRRQQVEVRTTEMAVGDLEAYTRALERALLSFHAERMQDINACLKELWQKTYRGGDIDHIAVQASTEGAGARSYSYRVVMSCGGAEMEMRGRCSAGQRVLACILIRLAMAESFCLGCGVLALDEPTTNLDAANAAGLAQALKTLIQARAEQEQFQLIVITHDEDFA